MKDFTLVLSTGRTGSIFLKGAFGSRPDLFTVAESGYRQEALRYLRWKHRVLRKTSFRHRMPVGTYYRWKYYSRRRAAMLGGGARFIEINNYLFPMIAEILLHAETQDRPILL